MPSKPILRLTTSVAVTLLLLTNAYAQQTTTNTTNTGSSGGGTSPGSSSTPLSATLPTVNVGNAAMAGGSGQSTGTTGRGGSGSRRPTGRTATTSLGLGLGTSGGGLGGARGVNTAIQTNRQNDRRAQYVTRVDFGPAAAIASSTEVATTVEHTLAAVVPNGISVAVEGSTAVLRGSVPSVQDRKLAEQMALLEPGVRSVRNELVVQNNSVGKP